MGSSGNPSDIVDTIKLLSGHQYKSGKVLSNAALDKALQHGPVALSVLWNGGHYGHTIMIESVSGGHYTGFDPWPPQRGTKIGNSYKGLARYNPIYAGKNVGTWTYTASTSSSASMTV